MKVQHSLGISCKGTLETVKYNIPLWYRDFKENVKYIYVDLAAFVWTFHFAFNVKFSECMCITMAHEYYIFWSEFGQSNGTCIPTQNTAFIECSNQMANQNFIFVKSHYCDMASKTSSIC